MNKTKKIICLAVLAVLLLTSVISLAACGKAKDALAGYMPSFAGKSVKDDFELPRTIGDNVKVKWKSSNSDAIEIVKRDAKESYLAKVKLGAQVQPVTLTVSATGAGSKDFTVNVQALNATLIASEYEFKYNRAEVSESFDLPTSVEIRGVTATISWSVESKYNEFIAVEGNRCVVTPPADTTKVEIRATFTYNNTTATMPYTFYVALPKTHREIIDNWYNNVGTTISEIQGYVVAIAENYTTENNWNNASIYMVDEDMCAGFYLYQVGASVEDGDKLAPGVHITVTSLGNQNFNGLIESTGQGSVKLVVDSDLPSKPINELIYALDNDIISGVPSLEWHTGALVSLTNWKITKKTTDAFTKETATMFEMTKDGVTVSVAYSKYMEGSYVSTSSAPAGTAIFGTKFASLNVGDYVSVTGILSKYSGKYQLLPRGVDDITAGTDDSATTTVGAKVKAAKEKVEAAVKDVNNKLITSAKELTVPTREGDVTISYKKTYAGDSVAIGDGKITVTPQNKLQNINIEVEYKIGNYTTWSYFRLRSQNLDDQGKANYVASLYNASSIEEVKEPGDVVLPTVETLGATITWSVDGEKPDWLTVGEKVTVTALPMEATTITLVVTVDVAGKTASAEIILSVAAAPKTITRFSALTAPAEGTYKLAMYNATNDTTYYALGNVSKGYLQTTDDPEKAMDYVITKIGENQYTIAVGGKYVEYSARTDDATKQGVDINMLDQPTQGKYWQWIDGIQNFVMESEYNAKEGEHEKDLYYFGTYSSYTTMGGNYISRIATKQEDGTYLSNGKAGVNQWVAYWGKLEIVEIGSVDAITQPAEGTYKFGLYQKSLEKWLYATGNISSNSSGDFGETTEDPSQAGEFVIAASGDGYTIKFGTKFLELNSTHRWCYVDEATSVWKWNAEAKVFTFDVMEDDKTNTYYLGTYGTYATISASTIDRITGDKASDVGETQFVGHFGSIVTAPGSATPGTGGGGSETPEPEPTPEPETSDSSIAALQTAPEAGKLIYVVEGIWSPTGDDGDQYGNGMLYDPETGKYIVIYGMAPNKDALTWDSTTEAYKFSNPKQFQTLTTSFNAGDKIKLGVVYGIGATYAPHNKEYVAYFISKTDTADNFKYSGSVECTPAENGTASLSKSTDLVYGETITITINPNSGYIVSSIIINGQKAFRQADGSYKFNVSAGPQKVEVAFKAAPQLAEGVLYKLDTTLTENKISGENGYAAAHTVMINEVTWQAVANIDYNPWRFGGNSLTGVDRTLITLSPIFGKVSKVTLDFGTMNVTSVNSVTLEVYNSDPMAAEAEPIATKTIAYEASKSFDVTPDSGTWDNCMYKLIINITVSGSSNKQVHLNSITFEGTAD